MRTVLLLLCLLVAGCQAGPGPGPTDDRARGRDTFGGRCSPYSSSCW
jgi:hypothetical protein